MAGTAGLGLEASFGMLGPPLSRGRAIRGCAAGILVIAVSTLLSVAGKPLLETAAFVTVFPLGVLLVTAGFGVGPAVFTGIGGLLVFDFVFVPPALAFAVPNAKDTVTLGLMIAVAGVASVFAELLRRQVRRAEDQVEIERLRNALLSILSHDLRTPLTALVGASAALCEDGLAAEARRDLARLVADEAGRLNRLVRDLLEMTRLESGRVAMRPTLQAIDEAIGAALVHLEASLRGRRVRTDVPEGVPLLAFDPVLIERVLGNLVENALVHGGPSSPIEIAVRVEGGSVVVDVADRGPGVPPGDEERIFDRLYRGADARGGGAGLGLTICRAIVLAHGGRIWFENRRGGGGAAAFTLPIGRPARSRSSKTEADAR
jgi:two-component system sensor histidine kinase KdpD